MADGILELPKCRAFSDEALAAGVSIYAAGLHRGMKSAYKAITEQAPTKNWKIGDYTTFTRLLKQIPTPAWEYIAKGPVGFELSNVPKIIRSWLSTPVYTTLCGDQNIPDYKVSDIGEFTPAKDVEGNDISNCKIQTVDTATGEVVTPELYLWMDCTSRFWCGLWPSFSHYNKYTIAYSLFTALRLGLPNEIFTDWGKPETSLHILNLLANLNGHITTGNWSDYASRYADKDSVGHKKAMAGKPWAKPIEPQMEVLRKGFLDRFTPGYRHRDGDAWVLKQRNLELKKARYDGTLLTTEEFFEILLSIAADHNNNPVSVAEQPAKIIPASVLTNGLREHPRQTFSDRDLRMLCLPKFERQVRQSCVSLTVAPGDKRTYYAMELSKVRKDDKVIAIPDPYDGDQEAVICDSSGNFLCLAEPWKVQDPNDTEELKRKRIRQAQLMKWWRKSVEKLHAGYDITTIPRIGAVTKVAKDAQKEKEEKDAAAVPTNARQQAHNIIVDLAAERKRRQAA